MRMLFFAISLCQVLFFASSETEAATVGRAELLAGDGVARMPPIAIPRGGQCDVSGDESPRSSHSQYGASDAEPSDRSASEQPLLSDAGHSPYLAAQSTTQSPPPEMNLSAQQMTLGNESSRQQRSMTAPPEPHHERRLGVVPRYLARTPPPLELSTGMFGADNVISPLSGARLVEWNQASEIDRIFLRWQYWPQ